MAVFNSTTWILSEVQIPGVAQLHPMRSTIFAV